MDGASSGGRGQIRFSVSQGSGPPYHSTQNRLPDLTPSIQKISEQWLPTGLFQTQASHEKLKIEGQPEGMVVVSCCARPDDETIWFAWQVYFLQAFERFDRGE